MVFVMYQAKPGSEKLGGVPKRTHGLWGGLGGFRGRWCRAGILLQGLGIGVVGRYGGSVFGLDRVLLVLWGRRWGRRLRKLLL